MWRLANNTTQVNRSRQLGVKRIRNVILPEFACTPARDVKKTVIQREIDVGDDRRNCLESLQQGWQLARVSRFGRDLDHLAGGPLPIVLMPDPNRCRKVLERNDHTREPVSLGRVVRRPEL